jgi:uncharacterized protein
MRNYYIKSLILIVACYTFAGCSSTLSYVTETQPLADEWKKGEHGKASKLAGKLLDKHKKESENNVIYFLERGSTLRSEGKFDDSNWHFQTALDLMDNLKGDLEGQNRAGANVKRAGSNVVALLSNINVIPYPGFGYDRLMAHTYKALNFLAMGSKAQAQVEFNRLYATQKYLVSVEYKKQISKDDAKVHEEGTKELKTFQKYTSEGDTGKVTAALGNAKQDLSIKQAYVLAPFVNPFSTYLKAIWDATNGDTENAVQKLKQLKTFGNNAYVNAELELMQRGNRIQNVTYVIFESNMAPFRKEELFETVLVIPVKIEHEDGNGNKTIEKKNIPVKIAFSWPKLVDSNQPVINHFVNLGGARIGAQEIADMDSIVAKEFEIRWPGIRNRIFLGTIAKTTGAVLAVQKGGELGALAASLHQELTKGTDSRTWRTLPSNFQICRFNTPQNRVIQLGGTNNPRGVQVQLIQGDVNVVYVKQNDLGAAPVIHQFTLK